MKNPQISAASKNSRRFPRYQHLSELSLTYEGSNQILRVHPPDISSKGMFINTSAVFPEGSILKLSFRLARTGTKIAARCEVRYCMPGVGLGVEFIDFPPESAHAVETEIGMANDTRRQSASARRRNRSSK